MSKVLLIVFVGLCLGGCMSAAQSQGYKLTPQEYDRAVYGQATPPPQVCSHPTSTPPVPTQPRGKASANTLELVLFEFRGCWPGDVISERALALQGYVCLTDSTVGRYCQNNQDHVGTVHVTTTYGLLDGKFAALNLTFNTEDYSDILVSFVAKVGEPHEQKQEIVQNRMGASFVNMRSTWHTATGNLEVVRYGPMLTYGHVNFIDYSLLPVNEQKQKAKGAAAAKDL